MLRPHGRRVRSGALAGVVACLAAAPAFAGHTLAHYPSYYPDEIRVERLDAAAAAKGLGDETLHAYVGAAPAFAAALPDHVRSVASLESLLVLDLDPAVPGLASAKARCAAARAVLAALGDVQPAGFVYHPYPVTPFHADYLHHLDRVEAMRAVVKAAAGSASVAAVAAKGPVARAIVGTLRPRDDAAGSGIALAEVRIEDLETDAAPSALPGGTSWSKTGWHQAHRLLAPHVESQRREAVDGLLQRLSRGEAVDLTQQVALERDLVAALTEDCRRVVAGYRLRREHVNAASSGGIENVAYDSLRGLNAPIFLRTAKLKDYPWNGSLRVALDERPRSAWNPVAGFTDPAGRLIWAALGDGAMMQNPFDADWTANRVRPAVTRMRGQSGGLKVPDDALRPRADGLRLDPVGARMLAAVKIEYEVLASPFLDGSETDIADLIYPYAFIQRWGGATPDGQAREPALAAPADMLRDRLAGVRPVRVERKSFNIAEGVDIVQTTPVLEVYLRDAPAGDGQAAALAPPWSTVPWHLLALMEEAVGRGYATFSGAEARRRGVPWLDLARDAALRARLIALCAEFAREGFRPPALAERVAREDARARWRALGRFAEEHGHLLVTNGPYRLAAWSTDGAVLSAVREATYPLGFGTFDPQVDPPRAVIRQVTREADDILVRADADVIVKVERNTEIRREPLTRSTAHGTRGVQVLARYVLVGPDGAVVRAGRMSWEPDDRFKVVLPRRLAAGRYAALIAIFLDGNALAPSTAIFRFEADGRE